MVALANKSAAFPQRPVRGRAQNHRYRLGAVRCSTSNSQAGLRLATYDVCNRSGSCSKDPIGYWGGVGVYNYALNAPTRYRDALGLTCDDPTLSITTNPQNAARTPFAFVHIPDTRADGRKGRVVGRTDWQGTLSCSCDECETKACPCVQIVDCKLHIEFFIRIDLQDHIDLGIDPQGTLGHEQRHVKNHLNWIHNNLEGLLYNTIAADVCSEKNGHLAR